jgi:deoxyribodipyrimidine photo-lyase
MSETLAIAWFRQDLRIHDNPALNAAAEYDRVLPIYILDDNNAGDWAMGGASRAWLHRSLESLNEALDGKLQLFVGDAREIMRRLVAELEVDAVFWNRCYEPWRIRRDKLIKQDLQDEDIENRSFSGSLLWEPWTVSKQDGTPYRVFTPFYEKGCLRAESPRRPLDRVRPRGYYQPSVDFSQSLGSLELLPRKLGWHDSMLKHWHVGEEGAHKRLQEFTEDCLDDYRRSRDFPAVDATSKMSPHLHFGEVSPQQLWHRIQEETAHRSSDGAAHFLREIGWREFSYYLLYHFPGLPERNFNSRFDGFDWLDDSEGLETWQQGKTGFPIVDAGLRELWQTGYMHNRVRMIVASFLIKNMLIDWRKGERWFWDCLVDADLASNSASWQWCAGSGADAAPYFRIFNPVLQSEKFDPEGEYLLRYCPELCGLPPKLRHQPWQASEAELRQAGIELGTDYPKPILDLKQTRERALARYKELS